MMTSAEGYQQSYYAQTVVDGEASPRWGRG